MTVREALTAKQVRVIGNPYPNMPLKGIYNIRGYSWQRVIRHEKEVTVHSLLLCRDEERQSAWVDIKHLELVS